MKEGILQLSNDSIINDVIIKKGIKLTTQRANIFNILAKNSSRHFTAKDIERIANNQKLSTSISTIYRTLELFEKCGIILRHNFNDDSAIYEYAFKEEHYHLICKNCGEVIEISGLLPDDLSERLQKIGFQYESYYLKIYGYCNKCRDRELSS